MSEDNMEVGESSRELEDFEHSATRTKNFLKQNKDLTQQPLSFKQKVARGLAAVGIGAAAITVYKSGALNTQKSEAPWEPGKDTTTQITTEAPEIQDSNGVHIEIKPRE